MTKVERREWGGSAWGGMKMDLRGDVVKLLECCLRVMFVLSLLCLQKREPAMLLKHRRHAGSGR